MFCTASLARDRLGKKKQVTITPSVEWTISPWLLICRSCLIKIFDIVHCLVHQTSPSQLVFFNCCAFSLSRWRPAHPPLGQNYSNGDSQRLFPRPVFKDANSRCHCTSGATTVSGHYSFSRTRFCRQTSRFRQLRFMYTAPQCLSRQDAATYRTFSVMAVPTSRRPRNITPSDKEKI